MSNSFAAKNLASLYIKANGAEKKVTYYDFEPNSTGSLGHIDAADYDTAQAIITIMNNTLHFAEQIVTIANGLEDKSSEYVDALYSQIHNQHNDTYVEFIKEVIELDIFSEEEVEFDNDEDQPMSLSIAIAAAYQINLQHNKLREVSNRLGKAHALNTMHASTMARSEKLQMTLTANSSSIFKVISLSIEQLQDYIQEKKIFYLDGDEAHGYQLKQMIYMSLTPEQVNKIKILD